ncbi:DUF1272 domain-containing protein [Thalassotalea crassostreae]|uniref:DUF1272 domain-containing protein n=1 Tax=Thalassotalea crassostreae TaxID=1763536 RepID=UPI0008385F8F|nr:DUF1272 domain-containing protein [Thalassotalea crassostreae]
MLELRPNCEACDKNLPPSSGEACICTYECTFCRDCVDNLLKNVCPNCGGGFSSRPIRPTTAHRQGVSLSHQPQSNNRVNTKYSVDEIKQFAGTLKDTLPENR